MIINKLIKIADSLDAKGKLKLSEAVDNVVKSLSEASNSTLKTDVQNTIPLNSKKFTTEKLESVLGQGLKNALYEFIDFNVEIRDVDGKEYIYITPVVSDRVYGGGLTIGTIDAYPELTKLLLENK